MTEAESSWRHTSTATAVVAALVDRDQETARFLIRTTDEPARLARHCAADAADLVDHFACRAYLEDLRLAAADRLLFDEVVT